MTFFDVYGPLDISREGRSCRTSQTSLWLDAEEQAEGLSSAIGCYLFAIKFGSSITPWYVGMTVASAGFQGEVFQDHKTRIYDDCLKGRRGSPVLFLFPLYTKEYEFSKARASGRRVISWLEKTLMGFAFSKNPDIKNVRDMTFLKNVEVLGLLGARRGRPHTEAKIIRRALIPGSSPKSAR